MSRQPVSPASSPPSRKTVTSNSIHSFFTPRRRPLSHVSSSGTNSRARVHLLTPDESPSHRAKRPRLSSSSPIRAPPRLPEPPKPARDAHVEDVLEPILPPPRKRLRSTFNQRVLLRSLGGASSRNAAYRGFHCANWSAETMDLHSSPQDVHGVSNNGVASLPFTTQGCNRNSLVAVGDESGFVRLVESAKDEAPGFEMPYITLHCHDNAVFDISWSPDDYQLATASGDQSARVFDVRRQECLAILRGHSSSVKQVSFNAANPSILTSCARDGTVAIWDLRVTGTKSDEGIILKPVNLITAVHMFGTGSARKNPSVTAAIWLEEHRIATASEANAQIKIWDLRSSRIRRKVPSAVECSALPPHHSLPMHRAFGLNSLSLSPDGSRLYALCRDSNVYTYATRHFDNGPIHAYTHPRLHASTFYVKAALSRNGRLFSTGSSDGVVTVFPTDERYFDKSTYNNYSLTSGSPVERVMSVGQGVVLVRGHDKEVTDVTWTVNGDLVSISDDYHARCWRHGANGKEAESMREGGEDEGRRWRWGWASKE